MKLKKILIGFSFLTISCNSINTLGYKNLGANYYIWAEDNNKYALIWCDSNHNPAAGGNAVTDINSTIVKYSYNEKYIVIKILDYSLSEKPKASFWLVDKTSAIDIKKDNWQEPALKGPFDSLKLMNYMRLKRIKISLHTLSTP